MFGFLLPMTPHPKPREHEYAEGFNGERSGRLLIAPQDSSRILAIGLGENVRRADVIRLGEQRFIVQNIDYHFLPHDMWTGTLTPILE